MLSFWKKIKTPILALAPMAGITDSAFRIICKKSGADVVYTEMISADGLFFDSKKTLDLLKYDKKEKPIVAQLFGKHPEHFSKAAKIAESLGVDGIDINFGCPAKKVVAHGGGVTLMRDLERCYAIVEAVCEAARVPVSVKIRAGIRTEKLEFRMNPSARLLRDRVPFGSRPSGSRPRDEVGVCENTELRTTTETKKAKGTKNYEPKTMNYEPRTNENYITAIDFAEKIKNLPISAIMVHGRTYEQGFSGSVDYEMIKNVKKMAGKNVVVLANGGIKTPADAKIMLEKTGADGVGLAQGVLGKPWLFQQIKDYLRKEKYKEFTQKQVVKLALEHAKLAYKTKGDHGLMETRKHLAWYVRGWPKAAELRARLVRVENLREISEIFLPTDIR